MVRSLIKEGKYLVIILLIALLLRFWGLSFGLPFEFHVDEVQYVRQAASMGESGLNPVWWNNPPFLKYIYLIEFGGLFVWGRLWGWYSSVGEFGAQSVLDPTRLYLLARGTSALLGTGTVLLTYFAGKLAYHKRVGLIAATFLAVCFLHVRDSHYATNDIAVTFLSMVVVVCALKIAQSEQKRWYIFAGMAVGLAFATKYTGVLSAIAVVVAHFALAARRESEKPYYYSWHLLVMAGLVAAISAVVASPYFVIVPRQVISDIYTSLYLAGKTGFDGWQLDPVGGYIFYVKSLAWGLGQPLLWVTIAGSAWAMWQRKTADLILVSYVLVLYLLMGRQKMYFARFLLPIVPTLLILAAGFTEKVVTYLGQNQTTNRRKQIALLVVLLLILPSALGALKHDYLLTQVDTRVLAKEWIESNLPAESKIAVDWSFYAPPLATVEHPLPQSNHPYELFVAGNKGLADHSLQWYREQGYDFLVASSYIYLLEVVDETANAQRKMFYESLPEELILRQVIQPTKTNDTLSFIFDSLYGPATDVWERERPGPTLFIYQVAPIEE